MYLGKNEAFSAVIPSDILQTHIFTRLDGPTLAAATCASSELYTLCTDDKLWQRICSSTWPSINDPRISNIISTFPSGYRSFFSDSYPLFHHNHPPVKYRESGMELISAVDVYYKNVPVFSKVVETKTESTEGFLCSSAQFDFLVIEDYGRTWERKVEERDSWLKELEENLTLSWILIDPTRKRAMNMSSMRAVKVERNWVTEEVEVRFAVAIAGDGRRGSTKEYVQCEAMVTCEGTEGREVHVREVSMGIGDMEGNTLCGKDSLVILAGAIERSERRVISGEGIVNLKERFLEFLKGKKRRKERMARRQQVLDVAFVAIFVSIFVVVCFRSYFKNFT